MEILWKTDSVVCPAYKVNSFALTKRGTFFKILSFSRGTNLCNTGCQIWKVCKSAFRKYFWLQEESLTLFRKFRHSYWATDCNIFWCSLPPPRFFSLSLWKCLSGTIGPIYRNNFGRREFLKRWTLVHQCCSLCLCGEGVMLRQEVENCLRHIGQHTKSHS